MSELGNNFGSLPFTKLLTTEHYFIYPVGRGKEEAFSKELEKLVAHKNLK